MHAPCLPSSAADCRSYSCFQNVMLPSLQITDSTSAHVIPGVARCDAASRDTLLICGCNEATAPAVSGKVDTADTIDTDIHACHVASAVRRFFSCDRPGLSKQSPVTQFHVHVAQVAPCLSFHFSRSHRTSTHPFCASVTWARSMTMSQIFWIAGAHCSALICAALTAH
jgi:hypothetical protein